MATDDKKKIRFRFDGTNEDAVATAQKNAAKLVTAVSKETQRNIRSLVADAIADGIPPYDAARMIVPMIGLTSAQGQAVRKYRRELIDGGLSLDKTNEKVDKYADELLAQRGETIARTEIMDALNAGQDEAWQQAQDEGLLSDNATKEWIVTDDDLLCEECAAMDGKTVPIGDDFPEGDPPLHPRCRCTTAIGTP
jgi:SPP1 gp7 family putative phage head morphogenesis protein